MGEDSEDLSWILEDMDEDDVLDLYDEKINLKNRRNK